MLFDPFKQAAINRIEKAILVNLLRDTSFATNSAKFSEFDSRNVTLFQINVFGRNIKETMLARLFGEILGE